MKRFTARVRGTRVTLLQLAVVSAVSAVVSAVIVVGALGETGPERAVVAALRTKQVIRASAPGSGRGVEANAAPAPAGSAVPADAVSSPVADGSTSVAPAAAAAGGAAGSAASDATGSSNAGSGSAPAGADSSSGGSDAGSNGSAGSGDSSGSGNSGGSSGSGDSEANRPSGPTAKIKHVFVIALSTPDYPAAFGPASTARYLNSSLRPRGEVLSGYHSLAATPLPDLLAMVSGQAPNSETEQGCPTYSEYPANASPAQDGLVPGHGCIYPNTALTIGDQLDGDNLAWRGYIGGMGSACQHPNSGGADGPGASQYTTAHNPFVYFHSLLDLGDCQSDDVPFGRLAGALRSAPHTPSYSLIIPDLCDFGAAVTCPGPAASATGVTRADDFLRRTVPGILRSPAYRAGGALMIVFTALGPGQTDIGPSDTAPSPGTPSDGGPVRTGALVLSAHTKPGTVVPGAYDPYAVLRTVEDIFGQKPLAKAKTARGFDGKVFNR